jgi:hypothetical protein
VVVITILTIGMKSDIVMSIIIITTKVITRVANMVFLLLFILEEDLFG